MWITPIIAAVSALAGVVLGQALSAAREHAKWVNDQRRLEYRQLLDELYEAVTVVSNNRPNLTQFNHGPVNEAVKRLSRVFADRIFIADDLSSARAINDWVEMKKVIYYDPNLESETPGSLRYTLSNLQDREDKLREKLLGLAKKRVVRFNFFGLWH